MTVTIHADGRRSVHAEVELAAAPKAAWDAIASGPGISAWFVPTDLDGRVGGKAVSHFAPDGSMDSVATILAWEPPQRFAAGTQDEAGPLETEWRVEAAGAGSRVRVTHTWNAGDDRHDAQFEGYAQGWPAFFRLLALYVEHFPGQTAATFQVMGVTDEPVEHAWAAFAGPLCLFGAEAGDMVATPDGDAPLAGTVAWAGSYEAPQLLVRLDAPAPGLAHLAAHAMGDKVYLTVRFYLYGDAGAAAVAGAQAAWQAWIEERFGAAG
jgi:uncharacterized protein YndB with AHSA1/START domain